MKKNVLLIITMIIIIAAIILVGLFVENWKIFQLLLVCFAVVVTMIGSRKKKD